MIWFVIEVLKFFVPCWLVNASFNLLVPLRRYSHVAAQWDRPLDGGRCWRDGYRFLGDSITWFSLPLLVIDGLILWLAGFFEVWSAIILVLAVYFGNALGSFIKRRLGYPRGSFLPLVDHGDYLLTAGCVFVMAGLITLPVWLASLALTYTFHPIACYLAYHAGVKTEPW